MPDAVSALSGTSFEGFVTVRDAGLRGMITLRGDLSDPDLKNAVTGVTGTDFPPERGITRVDDQGIAWMSPDELLVMVPYERIAEALATMETALNGKHVLLCNVSDARAVFAITGAGAREVLAKLTPADMSPAAFAAGEIRRSRIAQVAAAFWMVNDTDLELVSFRSTASYTFNLLKNAARRGAEVGFF